MKKIIIIIFLIMLALPIKVMSEEINPGQIKIISKSEALEIAKESIEGKVKIPSDIAPLILEEDEKYIVVFPTNLPLGVRGPDYYARIDIDKFSGEVLKILGGS